MGRYWQHYRDFIRGLKLEASDHCVHTPNYSVMYRDYLDDVFAVLDILADEAGEVLKVVDEPQSASMGSV